VFRPVLLSGGHDCLRLKVNDMEPCTSADRIVMPMQWGFVPCYYKKALADLKVKPINCRIETLREKKGTFSAALNKNQRCVVLADG
jgi:putative SOS response-associated peptidase YedK